MNADYLKFDKLKKSDRLDVFEAAAERLGTTTQAIEKDAWVCRVIDALFKGRGPRARPKLFFKGGTSLSKGYGLVKRFSEDIDIVMSRKGLYIDAAEDPLNPEFSRTQREAAAKKVSQKCSAHVLEPMQSKLAAVLPTCSFEEDTDDKDRMSLRVRYPSLLPADPYLKPFVKIECGARGALEPEAKCPIAPYIQEDLGRRLNLRTDKVTLISAERTFWEKALILHGIYCGFRDKKKRPGDKNLISRHYYDVAMMRDRAQGLKAIQNLQLLASVREHKQLMFHRGWEKLTEAIPGSLHIVPQDEIRSDVETDYTEMSGMIFGEAPSFSWIMSELEKLEETINTRLL